MNPPPPIGVIAHYNLLERLEPAGPGDLYRARDTRKGRTVAVRLLPADFTRDRTARALLIDRARGVGSLSHPNVTTLFDAGEHEDRVYLAFEFLAGQSLRSEMAGRPMNVRRAVDLAIQIAGAVADAHAAGFNHGGLSPDSVIVTSRGHAKIPAFELAARLGFDGESGGLRDYESPEEARGQTPDDRSDVYSVGAIVYEMLTARRPSHKGAAAPSVSNRHVTPDLDDIVLKAVAPNPDSRYQIVATFVAELRSVSARLEGLDTDVEEGGGARAGSTSFAGVLVTTLLILAVVGAVAFGAWWWLSR